MELDEKMLADDDDVSPRLKPVLKDLTPLGIAELEIYITGLEAEIARARSMIENKRSHRSGAETLFKR